ncbi:MAG TPA: SIMPL domain-containing protein [Terracidiphilus sp.]|nr:SIMPL domain-containing protein [Terracidiphilus sp.]HUX28740.1 SIMPL domain-containing protein [Terracidiphilus sp.]
MLQKHGIAVIALLAGCVAAGAQQVGQVQLKIEPNNRTLTVNAQDEVTVEPDVAILHVGFQTPPSDAKAAYAAGAATSNAIISALKQVGIAETQIRSEWQRLDSVYQKPHKFTLAQQWTVKVKPEQAAEILDVAVTAGATDSGQIEWKVEDEQGLEDKALEGAAARARAQAAVLARGMGVKLGALVYVSNQVAGPVFAMRAYAERAVPMAGAAAAPPLAIEPRKVTSSASVYAVFAIE